MKITGITILAIVLAAHSTATASWLPDLGDVTNGVHRPKQANKNNPASPIYNVQGETVDEKHKQVTNTLQLVCHTYVHSHDDFDNAYKMFQDNFSITCFSNPDGDGNDCIHRGLLSSDDKYHISKWFLQSRWGWCTALESL